MGSTMVVFDKIVKFDRFLIVFNRSRGKARENENWIDKYRKKIGISFAKIFIIIVCTDE
jgi:uncharacterized membrane protein